MSGAWLVLLVVAGLATFRLTRLIVTDDFPLVAVPRRWVTGEPYWVEAEQKWHYPSENGSWPRHWLGELVSCPWCASGWVSLGLVVAVAWWTPRDAPLVDWLLLWWASWALGSTAAAKIG
jgi:hypothetical protein